MNNEWVHTGCHQIITEYSDVPKHRTTHLPLWNTHTHAHKKSPPAAVNSCHVEDGGNRKCKMPELNNFLFVRLFNHSIGGWGRCLNKKADSHQMWVVLCACCEATIGCKLFFFYNSTKEKQNTALIAPHCPFFPWWIDVMKWCRWISCRYCASAMCYQVHCSWPDWTNNIRQLWIMHDGISPACVCCSGKLAGDANVLLRCNTFVQRDHMESITLSPHSHLPPMLPSSFLMVVASRFTFHMVERWPDQKEKVHWKVQCVTFWGIYWSEIEYRIHLYVFSEIKSVKINRKMWDQVGDQKTESGHFKWLQTEIEVACFL